MATLTIGDTVTTCSYPKW